MALRGVRCRQRREPRQAPAGLSIRVDKRSAPSTARTVASPERLRQPEFATTRGPARRLTRLRREPSPFAHDDACPRLARSAHRRLERHRRPLRRGPMRHLGRAARRPAGLSPRFRRAGRVPPARRRGGAALQRAAAQRRDSPASHPSRRLARRLRRDRHLRRRDHRADRRARRGARPPHRAEARSCAVRGGGGSGRRAAGSGRPRRSELCPVHRPVRRHGREPRRLRRASERLGGAGPDARSAPIRIWSFIAART